MRRRSLVLPLTRSPPRPADLAPAYHGWTGPCGLWIAGGSADIIFYEQETSSLHQEHIILHEASHLLCDHVSAELPVSALPLLLFPDLRPEAVWQVLQRATYGAHQEQEAELLASLIRERLVRELPPAGPVHDARTAGVLGRLGTSLEEHDRTGI